jgi:hypothetical protein
MRSLNTHREGWDEIERQRRALDQDLTVEESVRVYLSLYDALGPMMEETEEHFRPEREAYLTEMQTRLRRLDDWLHKHGNSPKSA